MAWFTWAVLRGCELELHSESLQSPIQDDRVECSVRCFSRRCVRFGLTAAPVRSAFVAMHRSSASPGLQATRIPVDWGRARVRPRGGRPKIQWRRFELRFVVMTSVLRRFLAYCENCNRRRGLPPRCCKTREGEADRRG